jgi:hypothetical protein
MADTDDVLAERIDQLLAPGARPPPTPQMLGGASPGRGMPGAGPAPASMPQILGGGPAAQMRPFWHLAPTSRETLLRQHRLRRRPLQLHLLESSLSMKRQHAIPHASREAQVVAGEASAALGQGGLARRSATRRPAAE